MAGPDLFILFLAAGGAAMARPPACVGLYLDLKYLFDLHAKNMPSFRTSHATWTAASSVGRRNFFLNFRTTGI